MKKLILSLLLLSSPAFADTRKYSYDNPQLNAEVDSLYHDLLYLKAVNVTASTGTFTQLNVSSVSLTGSINITSLNLTTGTINSFMVLGTVTNDSAPLGRIGQYIESTASGVSFPTTDTYGDLNQISLTAGDWDVSANMGTLNNAATVTGILTGISSTSGNSSTGLEFGNNQSNSIGPTATTGQSVGAFSYRISLAATTTIYQKFYATYTVAIPKAYGRLSARRVR